MRTILPLIALASVAAPALAEATADETVVTVRIDTTGLDVNTNEGRAALEARIDAKLAEACEISTASRYTYGRPVRDEVCIAKARTEALAQAERSALAKRSETTTRVSAN